MKNAVWLLTNGLDSWRLLLKLELEEFPTGKQFLRYHDDIEATA